MPSSETTFTSAPALIWLCHYRRHPLGALVFEALQLASTQPDMLMSERVLRIITLLVVNLG